MGPVLSQGPHRRKRGVGVGTEPRGREGRGRAEAFAESPLTVMEPGGAGPKGGGDL